MAAATDPWISTRTARSRTRRADRSRETVPSPTGSPTGWSGRHQRSSRSTSGLPRRPRRRRQRQHQHQHQQRPHRRPPRRFRCRRSRCRRSRCRPCRYRRCRARRQPPLRHLARVDCLARAPLLRPPRRRQRRRRVRIREVRPTPARRLPRAVSHLHPLDPAPVVRHLAAGGTSSAAPGFGPIDGLGGIDLVGFDAMLEWAVPALVLGIPGLLLLIAVLGQAAAGLLWLPFARRWLGGFGFRRRRRSAPAGLR